MKDPISEFEAIPGSSDRTVRGPISHNWSRREQARREFSEVAHQMALCKQSLDAHIEHFRKNPKDIPAAIRLARLVVLRGDIDPSFISARFKLTVADREYRRKMVELAEIPFGFRPDVKVDILDQSGSVEIHFGNPREGRQRSGCWILYANGALHQVRTPTDFFS